MQAMTSAVEPKLADVLASAKDGDDGAFARIVETYDDAATRAQERPAGLPTGRCAGAVVGSSPGEGQSLSAVIWSQRAPALWPMM